MPGPPFSIIITFYNQRDFVRDAVDSALSQPRQLREIIVVDDGSSDGTQEILTEYAQSLQILRFSSNRGAIEARNRGAGFSKGDYLIFLDGDDILMPSALDVYERIILDRHPKIILAQRVSFNGAAPLREHEAPVQQIEFVEYGELMAKDRTYSTCASSFVIGRQTYDDVGGWTPGIFHMDTVDFPMKLGYSGTAVLICSPPTVWYRRHAANSMNSALPFLQMAHRLLAKERAGEYPGGSKCRFARRSWLGGVMFYWIKRALKAGLYKEAIELLARSWSTILVGIIRRCFCWSKGRLPVETVRLQSD